MHGTQQLGPRDVVPEVILCGGGGGGLCSVVCYAQNCLMLGV